MAIVVEDLEKLNAELEQAQMLLRASHELYEDILVETTRHRLSDKINNDCAQLGRGISARIAKFGHRDLEIRRMLKRLETLTRTPEPAF